MVSAVEDAAKADGIVEQLDEEFKDRYTEKDAEFQATLDTKEAAPPVVPSDTTSSCQESASRSDEHSSTKRARSKSRSKSPPGTTLKRKGAFSDISFFVFHY